MKSQEGTITATEVIIPVLVIAALAFFGLNKLSGIAEKNRQEIKKQQLADKKIIESWKAKNNCQRSHYVSSKYEPVLIFKCADKGEWTEQAMLADGKTQQQSQ